MPMSQKLIGTSPSQVPRNKDLGTMAFQDVNSYYSKATYLGMYKNRLINGDFKLDIRRTDYNRYGTNQYVTCSSQNTNYGYQTYVFDQWFIGMQYSGGTLYGQRRYDSYNASDYAQNSMDANQDGNGFFYFRTTIASACSLSDANAEVGVGQYIESNHLMDFLYNTTRVVAHPMTLSFRVRASVKGLYTVSIMTQNNEYSIVKPYYIDSPNRWQFVTISFSFATTGMNWGETIGLRVFWGLGSGTNFQVNPAGTTPNFNTMNQDVNPWFGWWSSTRRSSFSTGMANLCTTTNATFDLASCQLEAGPVATSYDLRPMALEQQLCARYWQRYRYSSGMYVLTGQAMSTSEVRGVFNLQWPMREEQSRTITLPASGTSTGQLYYMTATGGSPSPVGTLTVQSKNDATSYQQCFQINLSSAGGYVAGNASILYSPGDAIIDVSCRMTNVYNQ